MMLKNFSLQSLFRRLQIAFFIAAFFPMTLSLFAADQSICGRLSFSLKTLSKPSGHQTCLEDDVFKSCRNWEKVIEKSYALIPGEDHCEIPGPLMPGTYKVTIKDYSLPKNNQSLGEQTFDIAPGGKKIVSVNIEVKNESGKILRKKSLKIKFRSSPLDQKDEDICDIIPPSGWSCDSNSTYNECSVTLQASGSLLKPKTIKYSSCYKNNDAALVAAEICELGISMTVGELAKLMKCEIRNISPNGHSQ